MLGSNRIAIALKNRIRPMMILLDITYLRRPRMSTRNLVKMMMGSCLISRMKRRRLGRSRAFRVRPSRAAFLETMRCQKTQLRNSKSLQVYLERNHSIRFAEKPRK